jgi:hypothetical protein
MKKYEKKYIAKGTKVEDYNIVRVSISKDKLQELIETDLIEYEGNEYLVFEIAPLKEADQFGKTHTVYINKKVDE